MTADRPARATLLAIALGLAGAGLGHAAAPTADRAAGERVHEHVIRPGDTLDGLARAYLVEGRGWRELARLNAVREPRRLRPGTPLRMPVAWLATVPEQAEVIALQGDVRLERGGTLVPIAIGTRVVARDLVISGPGGYATLRTPDGGEVVVQEGTRLLVAALDRRALGDARDAAFAVEHGALENRVPRRAPRDRFEIRTPLSVTAVRGTEFRAAFDPGERAARTEVLTGTVGVSAGSAAAATPVEAGFGVAIDAGGGLRPARLLPAPDLSALPARQERTIVRLAFPRVEGASGYRALLVDQSSGQIHFNRVTEAPEIRLADIPDGRLQLRVRAIDALRIEGLDAERTFVLKARPEPPFTNAPVDRGRVRADVVELRWTSAREAARYHVQIAADATFSAPVLDRADVTGTRLDVQVPEGTWHWRVASIRADGDVGPFGDPSRFERRPPPATPEPPSVDESKIGLRWAGEPGQTFLLQIARDEAFSDLILERRGVDAAEIVLDRPAAGVYHARVQATDPDGFVGPFTTPQRFEVPLPPPPPPAYPWWMLLILLLPLL